MNTEILKNYTFTVTGPIGSGKPSLFHQVLTYIGKEVEEMEKEHPECKDDLVVIAVDRLRKANPDNLEINKIADFILDTHKWTDSLDD